MTRTAWVEGQIPVREQRGVDAFSSLSAVAFAALVFFSLILNDEHGSMSHCFMSLMRRRLIAWMAAGITCASVVGCGSKATTLKTEEVEGVVTLDGTPVPEATVTFVPVQQDVGVSATGMTDAEGKYRLTAMASGSSAQPGAGTLPGEYYVGVVKVKLPEIPTSTEATMPQPGQRPQDSTMTYVVPKQYQNPQDSGIKKTVKEGKNDIPIELTSK